MTSRRRILELTKASDGRVRLLTLPTVVVLALLLILTVAVLPAGADPDSAAGVTPEVINLGGQPNDCDAFIAGRLPSDADHELRIENPQDGVTYPAPGIDGASVTLTLRTDAGDEFLDFDFTEAAVFDVVIKGGKRSTHWDYDGNGGPGPVFSDQVLHAPPKGKGLFNISHVSFCYDEVATISGTKFADADADGLLAGEAGLQGWNIHLFGNGEHQDLFTDGSGFYSFTVTPGTYTVCESLPASATTDWHQSVPVSGDQDVVDCSGHASASGFGYSVTVEAGDDASGRDFGNFETADVSGIKWHDRRPDGNRDADFEDLLQFWIIDAFEGGALVPSILDSSGTAVGLQRATTGAAGDYTLTLLVGFTYSICETPGGPQLPPGFSWAQSDLSTNTYPTWTSTACGATEGGHSFVLTGHRASGIDFGNHKEGSFCSDPNAVTETLVLTSDGITTTVTATCKGTEVTSVFDQGTNPNPDDENPFGQFTVFSGTPNGTQLFLQTIVWAPELALGQGDPPGPYGTDGNEILQVPITARLDQNGDLVPLVFCGPGDPDIDGNPKAGSQVFDCLRAQQINLGGSIIPAGFMQVIDDYEFAGDPARFR